MLISTIDLLVFVAFVAVVLAVGVWKGGADQKDDSESYFLAGRGLSWWLIGISLIAANISTEQFVGMSGQAAAPVGLAIASYEWLSAIALVVVAFFFLPRFLRTGIYTIPEFLEYRYDAWARALMAVLMMVVFVLVTIPAVIYSGAIFLTTLYPELTESLGESTLTGVCWGIGIAAAAYVVAGGLKACAWADLIQGTALLVGGFVILGFVLSALGAAPVDQLATTLDTVPEGLEDGDSGLRKLLALNADRLHMVKPASDPVLPWTALVAGLWVPVFYYWGLNQYIVQRTLGAHSLADGQRGIVFAAGLKLLLPFAIVFPGLAAFNLYSEEMAAQADVDNAAVLERVEQARAQPEGSSALLLVRMDQAWVERNADEAATITAWNESVEGRIAADPTLVAEEASLLGYKFDTAFGLLVDKLLPDGVGLEGFILAAILGAVISSLASMLNAASTVFTMDLFRKHLAPGASQHVLVRTGRVCVATFMVVGCIVAPLLADPRFGGVFTFIQEFQGFVSPGILGVFVFGFFVRRAPQSCGLVGLLTSPFVYGLLMVAAPGWAFLDRMAVTFVGVFVAMGVLTAVAPRSTPIELPHAPAIELRSCAVARAFGVLMVVATVALYLWFW